MKKKRVARIMQQTPHNIVEKNGIGKRMFGHLDLIAAVEPLPVL